MFYFFSVLTHFHLCPYNNRSRWSTLSPFSLWGRAPNGKFLLRRAKQTAWGPWRCRNNLGIVQKNNSLIWGIPGRRGKTASKTHPTNHIPPRAAAKKQVVAVSSSKYLVINYWVFCPHLTQWPLSTVYQQPRTGVEPLCNTVPIRVLLLDLLSLQEVSPLNLELLSQSVSRYVNGDPEVTSAVFFSPLIQESFHWESSPVVWFPKRFPNHSSTKVLCKTKTQQKVNHFDLYINWLL